MNLLERYENRMVESRVVFAERIKRLVQSVNRDNLAFFLIYYSSLGIPMVKPMKRWTRLSGKRCRRKGYVGLGHALIAQAKKKAGEHKWMIKDAKALVRWWNKKRGLSLQAKSFLRCSSDAVKAYTKLHEMTIKSDMPFGQLAIEFEIERVSVVHGFILIKACVSKFGLSVFRHMSFIRRYVKLNLSQTSVNKEMMRAFLEAHPEALSELVETGKKALQVYGDYLEDCFMRANEGAKKYVLYGIVQTV